MSCTDLRILFFDYKSLYFCLQNRDLLHCDHVLAMSVHNVFVFTSCMSRRVCYMRIWKHGVSDPVYKEGSITSEQI